ncbi:hypothetical protein EYF80_042159 [Liparis tanakae]|uniref:Uncharacterized protein n=1 Tax=Liparis tanakae TaxID=230148 RepID=A0A4Z2G257_9TELE|nr:hypothetical protein EYF80_042159 [Liparis tanakae]
MKIEATGLIGMPLLPGLPLLWRAPGPAPAGVSPPCTERPLASCVTSCGARQGQKSNAQNNNKASEGQDTTCLPADGSRALIVMITDRRDSQQGVSVTRRHPAESPSGGMTPGSFYRMAYSLTLMSLLFTEPPVIEEFIVELLQTKTDKQSATFLERKPIPAPLELPVSRNRSGRSLLLAYSPCPVTVQPDPCSSSPIAASTGPSPPCPVPCVLNMHNTPAG